MSARSLFSNWPTPDAVLHVGAGTGEELSLYLALGIGRIVLVEPDPVCLATLNRRVQNAPGVRLIAAALSSGSAPVTLHRYNHPMLNGLVESRGYEWLLPGLRKMGTRQVTAITAAELLEASGLLGDADNWLVVDFPNLEPGIVNGLLSHESIRFSRIVARCVPARRGGAEHVNRWLESFTDFGYRLAPGSVFGESLWPCFHLLPGAADSPDTTVTGSRPGDADIPVDESLLADEDWLRKAISVLESQDRLMDLLVDRLKRSP